jgi:hypothetical protein
LPDEDQAADERYGQQHPQQRPYKVHPEIAEGGRVLPGETADEGDADGQPGRAGQEVLRHQADRLGEVAQGGLAAIGLPGRGGREADRRVQRQVPGHRRGQVVIGRTAREPALGHQEGEQSPGPDDAEQEVAPDIDAGRHLLVSPHAERPIEKPLDRTQRGIEPSGLSLEHLGQIEANGAGEANDDGQEDGVLQPAHHRLTVSVAGRFGRGRR